MRCINLIPLEYLFSLGTYLLSFLFINQGITGLKNLSGNEALCQWWLEWERSTVLNVCTEKPRCWMWPLHPTQEQNPRFLEIL